MFPTKKPMPMEDDAMALEDEGLNDLKGFAEDGMVEEMMARLGLSAPGSEGDEQMDPPPVEDVPGVDPDTEAPPQEAAPGLDPEKLKALLASLSQQG